MKEEKDKLNFLKTDYKSVFIQITKKSSIYRWLLFNGVKVWN